MQRAPTLPNPFLWVFDGLGQALLLLKNLQTHIPAYTVTSSPTPYTPATVDHSLFLSFDKHLLDIYHVSATAQALDTDW